MPTPTSDPEPAPAVSSFAPTTKELITFITGATFANGLYQVFRPGGAQPVGLGGVRTETWALFAIMILMTLRFFYGNLRYVDCFFGQLAKRPWVGLRLSVDFLNILIESLLLASTSFFLYSPDDFVRIIIALLGFEVAWFLVARLIVTLQDGDGPKLHDPTVERRQIIWELNNTAACLLIALALVNTASDPVLISITAGLLLVNYGVDLWFGRKYYLGKADENA